MTEFQAALLMAQMTRLEAQARTREQNAAYLTGLLKQIPGITPARMYDGCTRNAYHLYMFRYDPAAFAGLSAGGVPQGAGRRRASRPRAATRRSTRSRSSKTRFGSRGFQAIYSEARLDRVARARIAVRRTIASAPKRSG